MENQIKSISNIVSPFPSNSEPSSSSGISWFYIFIILIILALLGLNIFALISAGIIDIRHILSPLLQSLGFGALNVVKQTINVGSEGIINTTNAINQATTNTINSLEGRQTQQPQPQQPQPQPQQPISMNTPSSLDSIPSNTLGNQNYVQPQNQLQQAMVYQPPPQSTFPMAMNASSSLGESSGKFCYIGTDNNGYRHCSELSTGQQCLSEQLFSTAQTCINDKK